MITPSHSVLNLAILRRVRQPHLTWPTLVGSWLPDAALFIFYGWARWVRMPEITIWQEAYYEPFWQDIFAVGNSIPLALVGISVFIWQKRPAWVTLFASMLLHHLEDLPLHHEDAHRHFWPLSNFRFISPVSYWDENHYGRYGALLELVLVLFASLFLLQQVRSLWGRGLLLFINVVYVLEYFGLYRVIDF